MQLFERSNGTTKSDAGRKAAKKRGLRLVKVKLKPSGLDEVLGLPPGEPSALVAVPYGKDDVPDVRGDATFYPSEETSVPYKDGDSFRKLNRAFRKADKGSAGAPVAGFWIVFRRELVSALEIWDDVDPGTDSGMYFCNRAVKARLQRKALKTVTRWP